MRLLKLNVYFEVGHIRFCRDGCSFCLYLQCCLVQVVLFRILFFIMVFVGYVLSQFRIWGPRYSLLPPHVKRARVKNASVATSDALRLLWGVLFFPSSSLSFCLSYLVAMLSCIFGCILLKLIF